MSWGFRIYTLEIFDGRADEGTQLCIDDIDGQDLTAMIECLVIKHLKDDTSLRGRPKLGRLGPFENDVAAQRAREDVDPKREPERLFHIENITCAGGMVTVSAESGKVNAHRYARSSTGDEPLDLLDRAAMRGTRSWFLVPGDGTQALVVAEVDGLSASLTSLAQWLEVASYAERDGRRWRFKLTQLADPKFVEDLLDPQRSASVTLVQHGNDGSRSTEGAKLQVRVSTGTQRGFIERALSRVRGSDYDRKTVLKDLSAVVVGADQIEFDDAKLTVDDAGTTTTLNLFKAEDVFTYRLKQDQRPSPGTYLAAAREVVERMPDLAGLALVWPEQGD